MPQGRDVCYKKGQAVFQVWQNNGFIQLRETGHVGFFDETLKREPRRHLAVEMEYKMCEVHNKFKAVHQLNVHATDLKRGLWRMSLPQLK